MAVVDLGHRQGFHHRAILVARAEFHHLAQLAGEEWGCRLIWRDQKSGRKAWMGSARSPHPADAGGPRGARRLITASQSMRMALLVLMHHA